MTTDSDAALVIALRDGNGTAFADLYDRYADRIFAFAFSRLRDDADAADALQNTWMKAHAGLDSLQDPARFRPWLFAIARSAITDVGRDRSRRARETVVGPDEAVLDVADDQPAPDRSIEAEETGALLWTAAEGLQPRDQELLELHLREGLDGAELAEAMEVDPSHLYVMVKRMKERLSTAVGSLLVARLGRGECPKLNGLLDGWEGTFSLAIRSQVTRHVEQCDTCRSTRKAAIAWESIASAMPAPPAPAAVRSIVLAAIGGTVLAPAIAGSSSGSASAGGSGGGGSAAATGAVSGGSSAVLTAVLSVVITVTTAVGVVAWPAAFPPAGEPGAEVAGVVEVATTDPVAPTGPVTVPTSTTATTTTSTTTTTTTTTTEAPTTTVFFIPTPLFPENPPARATTVPPSATTSPPITTTVPTTATTPTTTTVPTTTTTPTTTTVPTTTTTPTTTTVPTTTTTPTTTTAPTTTTTPTTTAAPTTTTTPTTTIQPAGPMLNVDPSTLDFGPNSTTLSFLIENTGDQQFSWTAAMSPNSSFTLGLAKDTAPPGYSKAITVSFPRNAGLPPAVGDYSALITVEMVGGGGSATIALTAKVVTVAFQPASIFDASCDVTGQELPITTDAIVAAADDDGIASVVATWEGGIPQTLKSDTGGSDGTVWRGTVGPWPQFTGPAEVPVTVTITDTRGNVIQVTESLMIHAC